MTVLGFFVPCVPPRSGYVFPGLPLHDVTDRGGANAELLGEPVHRCATRVKAAYLPDLFGRQRPVAGALSVCVAALTKHVLMVLVSSSQKQVRRVDARANVTAMAHNKAWWDWPVMQFPRGAMRAVVALWRFSGCRVWCDATVPVLALTTHPQPAPATFGLLNFRPKSLTHRLALVNLHVRAARVNTNRHLRGCLQ